MTIATTIDKTRKDIEKALADTGAIDAVVGTADLAAKKLRDARAELTARASAIDTKALRDQAQATVASAPDQVKALPSKAQAALADAVTTALTTYSQLSERGKGLVIRIQHQQDIEDLKDQAGATVSHAKGTATTAKKSAAATKTAAKSATTSAKKSAEKAAKDSAADTKTAAKSATTTAKKSAARTKTSAKSTTTSAKKTASAAKKAADATASKVGD